MSDAVPPASGTSKSATVFRAHSSSCSLFLKQLCALLWKCYFTRRVHCISTFFELIGPLILPIFIISLLQKDSNGGFIKSLQSQAPVYQTSTTYPHHFWSIDFNRNESLSGTKEVYYYSPDNAFTKQLVASLADSDVQLESVADEEAMRELFNSKLLNETHETSHPLMGVIFAEDTNFSSGQLSYRLLLVDNKDSLKLQLIAKQPYPEKYSTGPASNLVLNIYKPIARVLSHINRAYLLETCQQHHQHSAATNSCQTTTPNRIEVFRMPYPGYFETSFALSTSLLFDIFGSIIVFGYVLFGPLIVKRVTDEKQCKAKEMLRMMGMSDGVFWSSHFVNYLIVILLHALLVPIFINSSGSSLIPYSSSSLVFVYFLLYGIQLILFALTLTTLFNSSVLAVIVTVIFWFVSAGVTVHYLLPSICKCGVELNHFRRLTTFLPTGSLLWLFSYIGDLENKKIGLRWSNIASTETVFRDFTPLHALCLMVLSCLLYACLIFYLDNVWPLQPGLLKPPFFFLQPSYWCPRPARDKVDCPNRDAKRFESQPAGTVRIKLRNVRKSFSGKVAVDQLWLDIYEGNLTVLVGHNGAGKTTTMNMITGMFAADSGTIHLNGFDVVSQTNAARRSIGLCPQENIYFSELTVAQHLKLFALLKDFPCRYVNKEVNYILDLLALQNKRDQLADNLSGGMKRKLALGIALVGDTETLILDEPTSGLDPEARRVIWDLLISIRRSKTILLTTHYMEEADILGDRIAILKDGQLCCLGSPQFLKNAFGTGYSLRIAKNACFNAYNFQSTLRDYVPKAKLVSDGVTEAVYNLEGSKEKIQKAMPNLFKRIDISKEQLGIESCGLSYTTLEDVFLLVGADHPEKTSLTEEISDEVQQTLHLTPPERLLKGNSLLVSQVKALLLKRLHFARRYWPMFILQLLIPTAIITLAMYLTSRKDRGLHENAIILNTTALYGNDTQAFYYGDSKYIADYEAINAKLDATVAAIQPGGIDPINNWLLEQANHSLDKYIHSYLYGLQLDKGDLLKPWFNSEQHHSFPLSLVAMFEALLRSLLPNNLKSTASINISVVPMVTQIQKTGTSIFGSIVVWALLCLIFMPIAFPFLGASYILFPVRENVIKSKLIQLMSGVSPALFWLTNFCFDLFTHLLATGLLFLVVGLMDEQLVKQAVAGTALFLLIFLFGVASIPLSYAFSYAFDSTSSGFTFLTVLALLIGFVCNLIFSIVQALIFMQVLQPNHLWATILTVLLSSLRVMPIFSFLYGYQKVVFSSQMGQLICDPIKPDQLKLMCHIMDEAKPSMVSKLIRGCCPDTCGSVCLGSKHVLKVNESGAGIELLYLAFTGLVLLALIILYERYKHKMGCCSGSPLPPTSPEDSDVKEEQERVKREVESGRKTDLLTVHQLSKSFGKLAAVDGVSFGVRHNEVFGFLGVNGAGKTTCFSMLVGDLVPSAGNIYLGSCSLLDDMSAFCRQIGYVPQFDALLDELTGDETLYFYARLRGVPPGNIKRDVDSIVRMIGLEKHRSKLAGDYSGGNKRKLSIAIAFIGSPRLLLLDEPSAGVDPAARRKIWQTLRYLKRNCNSSIVLTSHSMDECEAMCSRIGIMVRGRLRCLGSTQHLRHKFGKGYSALVQMPRDKVHDQTLVDSLKAMLEACIPSAKLTDAHQGTLHFHITDVKESWATIFEAMNQINKQFHLEDYTVSDTTLEQIFLNFARAQYATTQ